MKQSAAKTLGVVALGAAFAAAAATSASAAPALPDAGVALDSVSRTLPLEAVTSELPAGAAEKVTAGRSAVGAVQETAPTVLTAVRAADPVGALLGGLPVNGLTQGGLPLGG